MVTLDKTDNRMVCFYPTPLFCNNLCLNRPTKTVGRTRKIYISACNSPRGTGSTIRDPSENWFYFQQKTCMDRLWHRCSIPFAQRSARIYTRTPIHPKSLRPICTIHRTSVDCDAVVAPIPILPLFLSHWHNIFSRDGRVV